MKITSVEEYSKLSQEEVKGRLAFLNEANTSEEPDKLLTQLKKVERTQHWLLWHNHAGIGSTEIMLFLVHKMYDTNIHLTSEEYLAKNTNDKKIDVQAEIEQPHLYMIGMCGSSDADQVLFIPTRRECLRDLSKEVQIQDVKIKDTMIFVNGDNPSIEFKDETWKGGHRGCVGCDGDMHSSFNLESMSHRKYKTLKEKQNLVLTGPEGKKGGLYPFQNLKIEQLRGEL